MDSAKITQVDEAFLVLDVLAIHYESYHLLAHIRHHWNRQHALCFPVAQACESTSHSIVVAAISEAKRGNKRLMGGTGSSQAQTGSPGKLLDDKYHLGKVLGQGGVCCEDDSQSRDPFGREQTRGKDVS